MEDTEICFWVIGPWYIHKNSAKEVLNVTTSLKGSWCLCGKAIENCQRFVVDPLFDCLSFGNQIPTDGLFVGGHSLVVDESE